MNNLITVLIVTAAIVLLTTGAISNYFNSQVLAQVNNNTAPLKSPATRPLVANANLSLSPRNQSMHTIAKNPLMAFNNITGSISIRSTIDNALASKEKVSLSEAASIAQKAVGSNSSTTLAFLRTLNGYLVYDMHVKNNSNGTAYAVVVDPGNGKILFKQALPLLFTVLDAGSYYGRYRGGMWGMGCGCH
jgi:hypothetical protein